MITELPYQVNPDTLTAKIVELADAGKVTGIADLRDDLSSRTGQRLVVVLKRDAQPRVASQLYRHTQLQETFGANMLALVDGSAHVPARRIRHQLDRPPDRGHPAPYRLPAAQGRGAGTHPARVPQGLDALDEVIALIRRSATVEDARTGLMELLDIDEIQATAILDMQLRRLAALERQKIIDEAAELERMIADYMDILANEARCSAGSRARGDRPGPRNERRSRFMPADDLGSEEDPIPVREVVVSITEGGYAKRTDSTLYRSQRRGGRGVRGATLQRDDVVEHFFITTTHDWILFFTNLGRVYCTKAYMLPDTARDASAALRGEPAGLPAG
ncbi:MAG: DNA gyrase subunit A [Candidatus Nanopelagicales bacterium]